MTLRDDPQLGPLFADLDAVLDGRPLEPLRPPISASRRWWRWAASFGGVALVAGVALWSWPGAGPNPADPPSVAPIAAQVAVLEPRPPAEPAAPRLVEPTSIAPSSRTAPAPHTPPAVPPSLETATEPAAVVPTSSPSAQPPADEPARDTLAAEERLYRPAEEALKAGAWELALSASDAYLRAYPNGRWVDKVWLVQLDALVGAGRWVDAAAAAADLADRPQLASRREDLLRIRGEALAASGDCAGALQIADGLTRAGGAAIRRACR